MKGDLHVRFREKFGVKLPLLTRLRGRRSLTASYSINIDFSVSYLFGTVLYCLGHLSLDLFVI